MSKCCQSFHFWLNHSFKCLFYWTLSIFICRFIFLKFVFSLQGQKSPLQQHLHTSNLIVLLLSILWRFLLRGLFIYNLPGFIQHFILKNMVIYLFIYLFIYGLLTAFSDLRSNKNGYLKSFKKCQQNEARILNLALSIVQIYVLEMQISAYLIRQCLIWIFKGVIWCDFLFSFSLVCYVAVCACIRSAELQSSKSPTK